MCVCVWINENKLHIFFNNGSQRMAKWHKESLRTFVVFLFFYFHTRHLILIIYIHYILMGHFYFFLDHLEFVELDWQHIVTMHIGHACFVSYTRFWILLVNIRKFCSHFFNSICQFITHDSSCILPFWLIIACASMK